MTPSLVLLSLTAGFGGVAVGVLHFSALDRVTQLYLGGGSVGRALLLQLSRLAVLGALLTGLAMLGALPLLSGALGLLVGRTIVMRRKREAA